MWSGFVKLDDLNDLFDPAQNCVKPLFSEEPKPDLIKLRKKKDLVAAQVNLYDCLACSGCVTTAETVLIQDQSIQSFLKNIESKICIISISNQSLSFFASKFKLTSRSCFKRLNQFFKSTLNVFMVLDLAVTDGLLLIESLRSFHNILESRNSEDLPYITSHCPACVCYAEKNETVKILKHLCQIKTSQQIMGQFIKTMTIDCINYALFKNDTYLLNFQGPKFLRKNAYVNWIKQHFPQKKFISRHDVYHVTIASCYDKKIESFRSENKDLSDSDVREVDLVLTTQEIIDLLDTYNIVDLNFINEIDAFSIDDLTLQLCRISDWQKSLPSLNKELQSFLNRITNSNIIKNFFSLYHIDSLANSQKCLCCCTIQYSHFNNSSNSFLEFCFRGLNYMENKEIPETEPLHYKSLYNMKITSMEMNDRSYSFILAYGYQHVQNIFRRIRNSKLKEISDNVCFIELMACPRGCKFGNAQFDAKDKKALNDAPPVSDVIYIQPQHHPLIPILYRYLSKENAVFTLTPDFRSFSDTNNIVTAATVSSKNW